MERETIRRNVYLNLALQVLKEALVTSDWNATEVKIEIAIECAKIAMQEKSP